VKLLLDEQISGKVAERLRGHGYDAIAVTADPSLRGLSDPDLFEVAQRQGRTLVTYNRADFEAIIHEYAATDKEHHGLIIVHPTRFPNREFARLVKALTALLDTFPPNKSFTTWLQEPGATKR
jgi:predicted nuclease of predicted toxin-antitoxin system